MDITKSTSTNVNTLTVVGLKKDGTPGSFASAPTFTVESGNATLSPGADENSQVITVDSTIAASFVIRVDANADLSGGSRIVTARVFLSTGSGSGIPANEVTDLQLTLA